MSDDGWLKTVKLIDDLSSEPIPIPRSLDKNGQSRSKNRHQEGKERPEQVKKATHGTSQLLPR